jgi:tetratricopeptide (TPR) repeat protein
MKISWVLLVAVCALVIGVYAYVVQPGVFEAGSSNPADSYYNLLVQGFRAGHLSVKKEVPLRLGELTDPYNLSTYGQISRLLDLSYYKGRLYLYFGVTPALMLFWPYCVLTGDYIFHRHAVVIFCAVGFLASVGLLRALWRRYFSEVSLGVVVALALALGLAAGVPVLLSQSDVWDVAISCGYMLVMLALGAVWRVLHEPHRRWQWLAVASIGYGLALGARPSLLFGSAILLVPVVQAWRDRAKVWPPLLAAVLPIALIGTGLMTYNAMRFGNPFEFGLRYQLHAERRVTEHFFGLDYLWFNFRVNFLEPAHWTARSPFVQGIVVPPGPPHLGFLGLPYGILTNTPAVWLALAVPLACWNRSKKIGGPLRSFVTAVTVLFSTVAITLSLYYCSGSRFEVEFLHAVTLLAVVGVLGLERALASRTVQRRLARCGWGALLGFSVAFNLLVGVKYTARVQAGLGSVLVQEGKVAEAFRYYQQALRIDPDCIEAHLGLGSALLKAGRLPEAIARYEQALRMKPEYAEAHLGLGSALVKVGRLPEAIAQCEEALRIKPEYAEAHLSLGTALATEGRIQDAIVHYEEALRIQPEFPDAHESLGNVLMQTGRLPEAIEQYRLAVRINPDLAEAHNNLGTALARTGDITESIQHYEEALRINPAYAEAHNNLGILLARTGRVQDAIGHFEKALRIRPDYAEAHYDLGKALTQMGRVREAVGEYEQALQIQPNYAAASNALARASGE